jgi:hypothetical protein
LHFGWVALAEQADDPQQFAVWPAGVHLDHGCGVQDKSDNCRCLIGKDEYRGPGNAVTVVGYENCGHSSKAS